MVDGSFTGIESAGNSIVDSDRAQDALNSWQHRNGGVELIYNSTSPNGCVDELGNVYIGRGAFVGGHRAVRSQISHEMGHYVTNVNWDDGVVGGTVSDPKFINRDLTANGGDGIFGYNAGIEGAGKYHVGLKYIYNGTYYRPGTEFMIGNPFKEAVWNGYGLKKWLYVLPQRF